MRWTKIRSRRRASRILNLHRQGKLGPEHAAAVAAAARVLLLGANRNLGPAGRRLRAAAGGRASWAGTTAAERSLTMKHRALVRKRARIQKLRTAGR